MAFFVNFTAVAVFLCSFWVGASGQKNMAEVKSTDNAEQFALLCRIYNVAKNPPIHHVDLQDPNKIVEDIDSINASLAEENQFNETEESRKSSDPHVKPTITREAAVAQAIVRRIREKAHNILKEIKKINVTEEIEKVKAEFNKVIFGEGGNENDIDKGALQNVGNRAAACGKSVLSSKGDSAGKNLVVDFFCLCAQNVGKNNGIENVCGVKVGSKDEKHSWGDNAVSGSSSMWASIKKGCGNLFHRYPNSTKEGHEVLGDFLTHLKSGGVYRWDKNEKNSDRKEGMLGTATSTKEDGSDLLCDGKKGYVGRTGTSSPPGGICVYYGSENEWQSIQWLIKLKNALNSTDMANNQTATIKRDIEKLQTLLHRAEQIYETAKVITEIHNPVAQTNFHTAAKRLTAYNAAWSHHPYAHSILTWILL